jgi:hypothetical protein
MHVDIAIWAIVGTQAAADAMTFDLDLLALAIAVDGIDGATDEAIGIGAGAATASDEPLVDPQAVANEARDAAMCVTASFRAFIAARAGFKIEDEESLGVGETLIGELAAEGR